MKKAVQPKTSNESAFNQFENVTVLSASAQLLIKGGDGEDETGIIVEDVIVH